MLVNVAAGPGRCILSSACLEMTLLAICRVGILEGPNPVAIDRVFNEVEWAEN